MRFISMAFINSGSERRRFRRTALDSSVRYKFRYGNEFGSTLTRDISAGGLRINVDKFIPINTDFVVEFGLDRFSNLISAVAKVVWAKRLGFSDNYQLGLEFQEINESCRKSICDYVKFF